MWFVLVWLGWEIHLPHWLNPADDQGEEGMEEEVVFEHERGTAGLLLSGLKSLGAPAYKQSQLCFQEDKLQVDMTVPIAFPVSGEVPASQSDCQK